MIVICNSTTPSAPHHSFLSSCPQYWRSSSKLDDCVGMRGLHGRETEYTRMGAVHPEGESGGQPYSCLRLCIGELRPVVYLFVHAQVRLYTLGCIFS